MTKPDYATTADLASLTGISPPTLWRRLKADPAPSVWLGRSRVFRWDDAEAWAARHRRAA